MDNENLHNKRYDEHREIVAGLRLLDDDLMKTVFNGDNRAMEVVLRIIMEKPDLEVVSVQAEDDIHSLHGRSVRLDVHAVDADGKHYDVEVQRADKGAGKRRARYNMGLLDSSLLDNGEQHDQLPEVFVIFITEHDVLGEGLPMYHIERIVRETKKLFDDGGHIIYVNGEYAGEDDIGKLMSDFRARSADEIQNPVLAEKVRHLKETEEGVSYMCKTIEDFAEKRAAERAAESRIDAWAYSVSEVTKKTGCSVELALDVMGIPEDKRSDVRSSFSTHYA